MRRLAALVPGIAAALAVAGCGGGATHSTSSSTTISSSTAVTETLGTTTATTSTTLSLPSTTTTSSRTRTTTTHRTTTRTTSSRTSSSQAGGGPSRSQLGLALCEQNVAQQPVLTGAEKSQLDALCRLAWSGHLTPARRAAANRRLCETMVADSGLTGVAATDAALSCESG